jgi:Tol biopolymer transport system component
VLALAAMLVLAPAAMSYPAPGNPFPFNEPFARQIGPEVVVYDWSSQKCEDNDITDEGARAFRGDDGKVQLIANHFNNYRRIGTTLEGPFTKSCTKVMSSTGNSDPAKYDAREWLAAPWTPDGKNVYMLVHNEYQGQLYQSGCPSNFACWLNSITSAVSTNSGLTYTQATAPSHLVAATPYTFTKDGPHGYFNPSQIVRAADGYYYAMIRAVATGVQQLGTCLMRTRDVSDQTSWRAWNGSSFSVQFRNPYLGSLTPADHVCAPVDFNDIGNLGDGLTYNTYFKKWMITGNSVGDAAHGRPPGVYYALSDDLLHWSNATLLMQAEITFVRDCVLPDPIKEASVLDPSSPSRNFDTVGQRPQLFYTWYHMSGCNGTLDRDLVRIPIEFSNRQTGGPTAVLNASNNSPATGANVTLDASGSSDDGSIANYKWDLDGDGTYERDTGNTPTTQKSYSQPGQVTVTVRVTDNSGKFTDDTEILKVTGSPIASSAPPNPAPLAVSGTNGKLAFSGARSGFPADTDLYTMNADGTSQSRITSNDRDEYNPTWSPTGQRVAYQQDTGVRSDIWSAAQDGTDRRQLTTDASRDVPPRWSPDGTKIAFASDRAGAAGTFDLYVMNSDGSGQVNITNTPSLSEDYPAWSPDGTKLVFSAGGDLYTVNANGSSVTRLSQTPAIEIEPDWSPDGTQLAYRVGYTASDYPDEIWKMNVNGTAQTNLTNNGLLVDEHPAWSPAGDKIAFVRGAFNNAEIYVMNADGSAQTRITNNTTIDGDPAWQRIPPAITGYPRPKGADVMSIPLVPAYKQCRVPNRMHGPALEHPSCNPPRMLSRYLTIGTPDSNGAGTNFTGKVVARTIAGNPSTPADEADVSLKLSLKDIRNRDDLTDYTGQLRVRFSNRRLTDQLTNAPGGGYQSGTGMDGPMGFTVPCVATSSATVGSTCEVTTTIDAISPGTAWEGARGIWELGQIQVHDGGADGLATTQDNDMFAVQGIYIP